jgi:hypothetical protein
VSGKLGFRARCGWGWLVGVVGGGVPCARSRAEAVTESSRQPDLP